MIPLPVLYHHLWQILFLRFNAQAFCWLSSVEENRTSLLLSVFLCCILLDAYPIPSPVFVGWYLRAYQLLPPKTHIVAPKRDLCLPFNISGFVGWCILCLTIWHLQKQSIYCWFFAFAELRFTCWDIRRYEDIPNRLDDPYPTWPQRTASLQRRAPQGLARKTWASPGAQNGKAYWIWSDSMFADFVRLFWKVRDFIEFVQCWVLFVSGCFYVFLQFNFPLASDLTIGFASWWCFFWFFSLLRHRKIPLEGFQLSHLNFLMDCKGYIMWHTTWDAHPMVQEENPGRMYLSWRISWRLKWFVTMLWQCLESQRRRGYIQQLGDSHNYGHLATKTRTGCQAETMIPLPVLYHHFWRILFLRFNAQAFCWLSSVEENRTSLLLSVFLCCILLDAYPIPSPCLLVDICEHINSCRQKHILSLQNEICVYPLIFRILLVDALFVSPSGTFKNKASIVAFSHLQN